MNNKRDKEDFEDEDYVSRIHKDQGETNVKSISGNKKDEEKTEDLLKETVKKEQAAADAEGKRLSRRLKLAQPLSGSLIVPLKQTRKILVPESKTMFFLRPS